MKKQSIPFSFDFIKYKGYSAVLSFDIVERRYNSIFRYTVYTYNVLIKVKNEYDVLCNDDRIKVINEYVLLYVIIIEYVVTALLISC